MPVRGLAATSVIVVRVAAAAGAAGAPAAAAVAGYRRVAPVRRQLDDGYAVSDVRREPPVCRYTRELRRDGGYTAGTARPMTVTVVVMVTVHRADHNGF